MRNRNAKELAVYYHTKMILGYLFGRYQTALDCEKKLERNFDSGAATYGEPLLVFYSALTHLAVYLDSNIINRQKILLKVAKQERRLRKWASHCPQNHLHKYHLVRAEKARVLKDKAKAALYYDKAISRARENGFINEEALSYELAGRFYLAAGQVTTARLYFEEARTCYRKWGAAAKVNHMNTTCYPLLTKPQKAGMAERSVQWTDQQPDLNTLMAASEIIGTETAISCLMDNLMEIVLKSAGARKGCLILRHENKWVVEARVSVSPAKDFEPVAFEECDDLPLNLIRYVIRTGKDMVFDHAYISKLFGNDDYIRNHQVKSALCIPMIHEDNTVGILFLENNITIGVFTRERIQMIHTVTRILLNTWTRTKAEAEILRYQDKLRNLSSELLIVEEKERRALALALHDQVGHGLHHAVLKLNEIRQRSGGDTHDAINALDEILDQSIQYTQTLTFELSPPVLYDLGLAAALDWLAEQTGRKYGLLVKFTGKDRHQIDETIRVLLFQSVRELLFNIVKHARAERAWISLSWGNEQVVVAISDNGRGFGLKKETTPKNTGGGFGLFSIKERLISQGGHMEINSRPGKGTQISLVCPLKSGIHG